MIEPSANQPLLGGQSPLTAIDPVEYCRGQVAALSYLSAESSREVHILAIRKAFERASRTTDLRYALTILSLLREVQELGNGYWLPTPLRAVSLGEESMIIAASPTKELARHFPGARRAGFARVTASTELSDLPHQSLESWTGAEPDSVEWARFTLLAAVNEIGPTLTSEGVEFFGTLQRTVAGRAVTLPAWKAKPSQLGIASFSDLLLCRERTGREHHRFFLGRVHSGRVVAEASAPSDVVRLQFGIASLSGRPISAVRARNESQRFRLFGGLPLAERRLFLALGRRESSQYGRSYAFRGDQTGRHVEQVLRKLGCDLKEANG